jgi:hypothetical protein
MTTDERVARIKDLDRLYVRAKATGQAIDWQRYVDARRHYERSAAA